MLTLQEAILLVAAGLLVVWSVLMILGLSKMAAAHRRLP